MGQTIRPVFTPEHIYSILQRRIDAWKEISKSNEPRTKMVADARGDEVAAILKEIKEGLGD